MTALPSVTSRTLDVDGRTVRVWTGGRGPTLLLLHGGTGDAALHWDPVWVALAEQFTVVAPDLPGFGGTERLPRCSFAALVTFALAVVKELGVNTPMTVVGNSFGGGIARFLAAGHPDLVSRLVLVDGGAIPRIPGPVLPLISSPVLTPLFTGLRIVAFSRRGLERLVADPATLTPDLVARMAQDTHAFVDSMREAALDPLPVLDVPTQPTLILWGAQDRLTPPNAGRAFAASIPGATYVLLIGAGHLPMLEQPRAFVRELVSFAADPKGGP